MVELFSCPQRISANHSRSRPKDNSEWVFYFYLFSISPKTQLSLAPKNVSFRSSRVKSGNILNLEPLPHTHRSTPSWISLLSGQGYSDSSLGIDFRETGVCVCGPLGTHGRNVSRWQGTGPFPKGDRREGVIMVLIGELLFFTESMCERECVCTHLRVLPRPCGNVREFGGW